MDVSFGLNDFVELNDVGMAQNFEDADLSGNSFDVRLFDNFLFLKGFDGDFFFGQNVGAEFNFAESTFTDGAAYPIVAEYDLPWRDVSHENLNFYSK